MLILHFQIKKEKKNEKKMLRRFARVKQRLRRDTDKSIVIFR